MQKKSHYLGPLVKQAGYRSTVARDAVFSILENSQEHLGAEEIVVRAKQLVPVINIASVYRTLNLLDEMGLIHEVRLGDGYARWGISYATPELHLHCRECDSIEHIDFSAAIAFARQRLDELGFIVQRHSLVSQGLCRDCVKST